MSHIIRSNPALIAVRCDFIKCSAPLTYRGVYHARLMTASSLTFGGAALLIRYGAGRGEWRHFPRRWFTPLNPRHDAAFGFVVAKAA